MTKADDNSGQWFAVGPPIAVTFDGQNSAAFSYPMQPRHNRVDSVSATPAMLSNAGEENSNSINCGVPVPSPTPSQRPSLSPSPTNEVAPITGGPSPAPAPPSQTAAPPVSQVARSRAVTSRLPLTAARRV